MTTNKYYKYIENNVVYYYRINTETGTILRLSKDLNYPEDLYRTYRYTSDRPIDKDFTNNISISADEFKAAVMEVSDYLLNSQL